MEFAAPTPVAPTVLIFAGIHGDEPTTAHVADRLVELLGATRGSPPTTATSEVRVVVVPRVNPDGLAKHTRENAHGVDLNRNFPAKNWRSTKEGRYWNGPEPLSEPESKALHDLVVKLQPVRIVAIHSIRPPRHGVNYDGPARELAEAMAARNHYNVLPTIGYPTPGSFGSWAGIDRGIPVITLELPSNASGAKAWEQNREALLAFIAWK